MLPLYKSTGKLQYFSDFKLALDVDPNIALYYRSLIPLYLYPQPTRYMPHITVVRPKYELPVHKQFWNKYRNEQVEFYYEPWIHSGKEYFWLNIFSVRLEQIRAELGLYIDDKFTKPPEGFRKCFHMTVANRKHDQIVLR